MRQINIVLGCHGIPERCLSWRGKKMDVCARCFGARVGHALALGLFVLKALPPWWVGVLMILPMMIDGSLQMFAGVMSTNVRRFWTGVLGGLGVSSILWQGVGWVIRTIGN